MNPFKFFLLLIHRWENLQISNSFGFFVYCYINASGLFNAEIIIWGSNDVVGI